MDVSTLMLRGLLGVLATRPTTLARLLHKARLDPRTLLNAEGVAEVEIAEDALRDALESVGGSSLGLSLALRAPLRTLGILGDVVMHAPTLRVAIEDATRYARLLSPGSLFRLREATRRASLLYDAPSRDPVIARFCAEVALGFAARIGRRLAPGSSLLAVHLRGAPPTDLASAHKAFGCAPSYGAERDELVFARALLDAPQPFGDPALHTLYSHHAEHLLTSEHKREPLHEQVKRVLRCEVDLGFVKPAAVARRLGLTPRKFRRQLSAEGHSLTELADQVRRELALEAVGESDVPIKRISERVGFGEVSSFHRAFKRWTGGIPPARYRSEAQAGRLSG